MPTQSHESLVVFPEEAPLPPPLVPERQSLSTRSGRRFDVRPARQLDLPALRLFLSRMTPGDLRFRFLTPVRSAPDGSAGPVSGNDHARVEHFLAFEPDGSEIVGSAVIAMDRDRSGAEIAICIGPDVKSLGLSCALLKHAKDWAAGGD